MPANMKIYPEEWNLDLGKIGDDYFWAEFYKGGQNLRDERGILYGFHTNVFTSQEEVLSKKEKERFCDTIITSAPQDSSVEEITLFGVYLIKEVINQRLWRNRKALERIQSITNSVEDAVMAKLRGKP